MLFSGILADILNNIWSILTKCNLSRKTREVRWKQYLSIFGDFGYILYGPSKYEHALYESYG